MTVDDSYSFVPEDQPSRLARVIVDFGRAQAAGVTRGALYHQFNDKRDLFRAMFEAQGIAAHVLAEVSGVDLAEFRRRVARALEH